MLPEYLSFLNELLKCGACHVLGALSDPVSLTQMINNRVLSISCRVLCVKCLSCIKIESFPQSSFSSFSQQSPYAEVTSCGHLSRNLSKNESRGLEEPLGTIYVL